MAWEIRYLPEAERELDELPSAEQAAMRNAEVISELPTAEEIHERHMREDPEYAAEYERTAFANEVAIMVLKYRTDHGLTQAQLARKLGMRQPNIARLESGEHEPSISTLARLAAALGLHFGIDVAPGRVRLREVAKAS